jgi:Spy/CpxP family protein refolding chaperone
MDREENSMIRARSTWLAALTLSTVLTVAGVAGAADTATSGTPPTGKINRFQQALGLTDDQMTAIRQVQAQQAPKQKQLRQSIRQNQAELRQLALNGGDPAAIQAKQAEVGQLLNAALAMRVESLQAMAPILTPDQRAKLAEMQNGYGRGGHWHRQQGS